MVESKAEHMCSTVSCPAKRWTARARLLVILMVLNTVASQPTEQCGAAILDMLMITPAKGIPDALGQILESDSRCTLCLNGSAPTGVEGIPPRASGQANFTWMPFPSWGTSLVFTSVAALARTEPFATVVAELSGGVQLLPDIDAISSAEQLSAINGKIGTVGPTYSIYGMDYSGKRLEGTNLQKPQFDIPENAQLFEYNVSAFRGVVHPRTYLLTFFRADVLARFRIPVPTDWEGLLALLQLHRQAVGNLGGPAAAKAMGIPEHGLCLTVQPTCGRLGDVLTAMAATVVQTRGTAQGYVYDLQQPFPAAVPLTNSSGWMHAATLLAQLLEYNAPDPSAQNGPSVLQSGDLLPVAATKCPPVSPAFLEGKCLFTFEWDTVLPLLSKSSTLRLDGVLGIAPLPGSRTVVDPSTGQLRECTAELCSTSLTHDLLYMPSLYTNISSGSGANGSSTASSSSNGAPNAGPGATAKTSPYICNRAPYSALLDLRAEVNQEQPGPHVMDFWNLLFAVGKDVVYTFREQRQNMTNNARAALGYARLSGNGTAWDGARYASFPWWKAQPFNFVTQPFVAQGLNKGAMESYVTVLWHAVHHPNLAVDPPSPLYLNWYIWGIHWAAARLLPEPAAKTNRTASNNGDTSSGTSGSSSSTTTGPAQKAATVLGMLTIFFNMAIAMHGPSVVRQTYSVYIGERWSPPKTTTTSGGDRGGVPVLQLAVALPVATVVVLVVAAVGGAWLWMRRRNRDLLGRVRAPRAGPDTTLLVSDVQNSTLLWEQLDAGVMEEALHVHHAVFRGLLPKYGGYESATEGDSFLIAFPSPAAACAFAAAVQLALLEAAWPQQLLEHPDGAELVVRVPNSNNSKDQQKQSRHHQYNDHHLASADVAYSPSIISSLRRQSTVNASPYHAAANASVRRNTSSSRLGATPGASPNPASNASSARHMQPYGPYRSHGLFTSASLPLTTPPASDSQARRRSLEMRHPPPLSPAASGPKPHVTLTVSGRSHRAFGAGASVAGDARAAPALLPEASAALDAAKARDCSSPTAALKSLQLTLTPQQQQQQQQQVAVLMAPYPETLPSDGPELDTAGSNVIQPVLGPDSSMRPNMSTCDLGSFAIGRTSHDTATDSDMEPWSPACVTWREAMATAFPIMAAWPLSVSTPGGVAADGDKSICGGSKAAQQQQPDEELRVVCRGFRVRMGLHSGLDSDQHVLLNKVSMSYKYYGPFAEAAHATNDTAPGGLIALSAAAFDRLKNAHKHRGGGSGTPDAKGLLDNIMIVYAGHHDLSQAPPTGKASAAPQPSPPAPSRTGSSSQLPASCDDDSADVTAAMASALDTVLDVDPCPGFTAAAAAAAAAAAVPDTDGTPLYVALPRALLCRLAYLPPLRTAREVQLGSLRAPTGCVCIGFVKVVGAGALMADVPAVATRALAAFHSLVCRLLGAAGGYLVEGGDGVALVALGSAARAVEWALGCVEQLKELDWDPELLAHELCEEVYTFEPMPKQGMEDTEASTKPMPGTEGMAYSGAGTGMGAAESSFRARAKATAGLGRAALLASSAATADAPQQAMPQDLGCDMETGLSGPGGAAGGIALDRSSVSRQRGGSAMHRVCVEQLAAARQLVYRGLRVKIGMDVGHVSHTLGAASARLEYRGKVMNRAARIAAFASAGQVCVSAGLWQAAEAAGDFADPQQRPIVGHSMGLVPLKGVTTAMEIISCVRKGPQGRASKA